MTIIPKPRATEIKTPYGKEEGVSALNIDILK
jgi:hypothetical protein